MSVTVEKFVPVVVGDQVILRAENRLATVEAYGAMNLGIVMGEFVASGYRVVGRRRDGTGREYTATLPACLADRCMAGEVEFCLKPNGHIAAVNAWLKHVATHCHGWHEPSLIRFMAEVLATYGSAMKWRPRTVGARR